MPIVGGLDIHRKQITFDYLDTVTGEVRRGQIAPAGREHLRAWLSRFAGRGGVAFAVEGCTGWRYVAEELAAAGIAAHLAEPADRPPCRPGGFSSRGTSRPPQCAYARHTFPWRAASAIASSGQEGRECFHHWLQVRIGFWATTAGRDALPQARRLMRAGPFPARPRQAGRPPSRSRAPAGTARAPAASRAAARPQASNPEPALRPAACRRSPALPR